LAQASTYLSEHFEQTIPSSFKTMGQQKSILGTQVPEVHIRSSIETTGQQKSTLDTQVPEAPIPSSIKTTVPEAPRLLASLPALPDVPEVTFIQHNGYISESTNLLTANMTILEAMRAAAKLPGCQGFCFSGDLREGVVDACFKGKCTSALSVGAEQWTTVQLLRHPSRPDLCVQDPPTTIQREELHITLSITTLDGCEMTIRVADSKTLQELKALIRQEKGDSCNYKVCSGTQFFSNNSATLSALGIADKMALTLIRRPKYQWKRKQCHKLKAQSHIVSTAVHKGNKTDVGKFDEFISSAKARCEEEDWAGFLLTKSVTHQSWGIDGERTDLECQVHYLAGPFRASADTTPAQAERWGGCAYDGSAGANGETTHDLHYGEDFE